MPKTHTVVQGDTLISLAHQNGFRDWRTIYYDPSNDGLRARRPDPMALKPGDSVTIPDKVPLEFEVETNQRHSFTLTSLSASLDLVLEDDQGEPYRRVEYRLVVEGGPTHEDWTDAEGAISAPIPPDAKKARLTLWPDGRAGREVSWSLDVGHLDPSDEPSGIKGLLANHGYDAGPVDEDDPERLSSALSEFQVDHDLEPTGQPDAPTMAFLTGEVEEAETEHVEDVSDRHAHAHHDE